MAADEPVSWEIAGTKPEKPTAAKQMGNPKKAWNTEGTNGVAAVEAATGSETRRWLRFFHSMGCDKSHLEFTCELLRKFEPEAKKRPSRTMGCACSV